MKFRPWFCAPKLPYLASWNEQRRKHASLYTQLLKNSSVIPPIEKTDNCHVYHLYVIQAPRRDELQTWLKSKGIFTGIHYPIPIHLQASTRFLGYQKGDLPVTEEVATKILSLPMYAELTCEELQYIGQQIKEFYKITPLDT